MTTAIDCLVNVGFADEMHPDWMVRVKEDYFKGDDSFFHSPELPELLDDDGRPGVERAILMTRVGRRSTTGPSAMPPSEPDRFALGRRRVQPAQADEDGAGPGVLRAGQPGGLSPWWGPASGATGMYPPTDAVYFPLYTKCCELDLPLCMNTGLPGPPLPGEAQNPIHLDRVCLRFPELKLCMIHGADPWWDTAIRLMLKYKNLRLMTSAWSPKRLPESLLHFMRTRGTDRILFASDYPVLSMERCLGEAAALDLPDDVRAAWLHDNAEAFFFADRRDAVRGDADGRNDRSTPTTTTTSRLTPSPGTSTRRCASGRCAPCRTASGSSCWSAGRVNKFVPNPTFDPIIVPGCLDPLFRGQIPEGVDPRTLMQTEPLRAEYQDRERRLEVMDEQGLGAALLFPTLGVGVEEALPEDIGATMAAVSSFNRWLEEDWGFAHQDRIFAVPLLSLADPDAAVTEVEWLLEHGVRMVHVRPAPVPGPNGTSRSLGDKLHDPVWARLAEASVPVAFHLGDSGYQARFATAWGGRGTFGFGNSDRSARSSSPTGPSTTPSPRCSCTGCSSGTRRCGWPASRTARTGSPSWPSAAQAGQPDAVGVRRRPTGDPAPPRVGHAVPRGGPRGPGRR